MLSPGRIDISADRWVACIRTFAFLGLDLTGADFAAQVRQKPDASGAAVVNLTTQVSSSAEGLYLAYAGTDTIANHITNDRLAEVPDAINPETGVPFTSSDSIALSQVKMRINETTMEALPYPAERGDDLVYAWDLHITPAGGIKDKYLGGDFTIRAGVTQ